MIADTVIEIIAQQLLIDDSEISMRSYLEDDLGMDELDRAEVISGFESEFGIRIPDRDADGFETVRDIVSYIEENAD